MIIPSIDIMNGQVVQLRQGRELVFTDPRSPVEVARSYARYGPVAVVDLDAAMGRGHNRSAVEACCRVARCRVGGGVRTADDVKRWIKCGAEQVMIGTAATAEFLSQFPRSWLIVALDAWGDEVMSHGWTQRSGALLLERARELAPYCDAFLFTQVEREGGLGGPDRTRALALQEATDRPVIVAGGVQSCDEIGDLIQDGLAVQIGRAIYEGHVDLVDAWIAQVRFGADGLVPTVVQDARSRDVLMLAYSSPASLERALSRGEGWYYSRSRQELWQKGWTSGHTQSLRAARWDCDRDALIFEVDQSGPCCHRNRPNCFELARPDAIETLSTVIDGRRLADTPSYTRELLGDPVLLASKLREEIEEVIEARDPAHVAWECADVLYHMMVYMAGRDVDMAAVQAELRSRQTADAARVSAPASTFHAD